MNPLTQALFQHADMPIITLYLRVRGAFIYCGGMNDLT